MKEKNRKIPIITFEQPPIDDTIPIGLISDPLLCHGHHSTSTNMSLPNVSNFNSLPCLTVKEYLAHCNISSTLLNNPIVETLCSNIEKAYQKKLEERSSCLPPLDLSTVLSQLIQINSGQEIGFSIISNITLPTIPHRIIIRRRSFRLIHIPENEKDFSSSIEKEIYDEIYYNATDMLEQADSKNIIKKEIHIQKIYYNQKGNITSKNKIKNPLPSQLLQYQDYDEKEL